MALTRSKRFDILQRDDFTCRYCGATSLSGTKLEVDHVIPIAGGGTDYEGNLVTACFDCNRGKRAKNILPIPPQPLIPNISHRETKAIWSALAGDSQLSTEKARAIRTFILAHGADETLRAAAVTKLKNLPDEADQWRYFCGVNWRWIKAGIADSEKVIPKRSRFTHRKSTAWSRMNPPPEK